MTTTTTPAETAKQAQAAAETLDVQGLALAYADAAANAQPWLDAMADIKAKLLEALPVGTHPAGPLSVQVKAGARTLDAKKLEAAFPLADNPLFYKQTLDTNAVKQFVAPVVLEQYQRQNAPSLVIK